MMQASEMSCKWAPRADWRGAIVVLAASAVWLLGWAVVTALEPLGSALSAPALWLLVAGGLVYTVGVVFHLMDRMPYNNAVWHLFVLTAASCHFAAIAVAFL